MNYFPVLSFEMKYYLLQKIMAKINRSGKTKRENNCKGDRLFPTFKLTKPSNEKHRN